MSNNLNLYYALLANPVGDTNYGYCAAFDKEQAKGIFEIDAANRADKSDADHYGYNDPQPYVCDTETNQFVIIYLTERGENRPKIFSGATPEAAFADWANIHWNILGHLNFPVEMYRIPSSASAPGMITPETIDVEPLWAATGAIPPYVNVKAVARLGAGRTLQKA